MTIIYLNQHSTLNVRTPPFFLQVLVQECIRYNKLIDIMERSLPELQKALKGLVVMSGELEAVGKAIALNAVPKGWEAKVRTNHAVFGKPDGE